MVKKIVFFLLSLLLVLAMMPTSIIVKDVNAASTYYVVFNGNGATSGSMSKQTLYVGVTQPLNKNTFKKTNDTFVSWNTKKDGTGTSFTDGASVRNLTSAGSTVTLYAQWKNGPSSGGGGGTTLPSGSIVVTYNGNGATSGSMSSQTLTNGEGKLSKNRFARTNASFLGWSTSKTATKPTYYDGEYVTLKSSVTLYAVWSNASNITVTFVANGGSGGNYTQTMPKGVLTPLDANKFTRSGYGFAGWAKSSGGSVVYTNKQSVSFSGNTTLYAVWKKNAVDVTITFDKNGGTGTMSNQLLKLGEGKLSKNLFTRSGYSFKGWSTSKTASQATYADGEYVKFSKNTTLYAVWSNGGSTPVTPTTKKTTISTSYDKLVVNNVGVTSNINGKASSGAAVTYKSSNSSIVSVDSKGKLTAKKAGTATITVSAKAKGSYPSASKKVTVVVPSIRGRVAALKPWHDCLVDTFSYINGRKYSYSAPGKYWTKNGKWTGKTGKSGNTQSCITLPTVSLKRMGLMGKDGSFWFNQKTSKNGGGKHEASNVVKKLKKKSKYLTISYHSKSMKSLVNSGKIQYGDVICKKYHTYVYMGTGKNDYRIFTSGSLRDIGQGTRVSWGHSGAKTSKISSQIRKSDAALRNHPKSYFKGRTAPKNYQNSAAYIVGHINTFTVKTTCVNGSITGSNLYMANQNVTIKYSPISGKKISYVEVDGKKVSGHGSSYTFKNLSKNHTIKVVYK